MSLCKRCRGEILSEPLPEAYSRPLDVYQHLRKHLSEAKQEKLMVVFLDAQNRILGKPLVVSQGSLNTTRTQPREVFAPAIERRALGVIMAHNHPSGSLKPSGDDVDFTRAIKKAGEILGIGVYDHLIITKEGFTSMKEEGLL